MVDGETTKNPPSHQDLLVVMVGDMVAIVRRKSTRIMVGKLEPFISLWYY